MGSYYPRTVELSSPELNAYKHEPGPRLKDMIAKSYCFYDYKVNKLLGKGAYGSKFVLYECRINNVMINKERQIHQWPKPFFLYCLYQIM